MPVPISNVTRRVVYAPSGAGGAGPYAFTFEILANTDIAVFKDDVLLTLTTHYTVSIAANGTGSVTITAAGLALSPVSPTQYAIVGNRTISRATDFTTGGDFFANTINDELDQQTIFAQQNAEGLQRALTAPQTDPTTIDMTLPKAADRANKTLAFDANGDPTLGISAADVANAVTYATNAANSATAAASSASAAASSASSASGSASTASTQASNASTSASNASSSASSASSSASSASTSASNASTSASNASTSASNASTSATNAAASASTATTQATNASNSASSASTSATNAATSETNAAASAASAASALDSFDDRYLGSKTSDPTLDNDGNALVTGALYYRSTAPIGMKVYDGAQWIEASAAQQAALVTYEYVATAAQTTFSGADANSLTLSYIAGGLIVSLNGAILRPGDDYTATNGTSIVLVTAASLNDELCAYAFSSFLVANTYTQAQTDSLLAAKAPLASPALTGTPTAPTAAAATNTTQLATTAFVSALTGTSGINGFKNRIINGAMVIDQRNAGASVTVNNSTDFFAVDRWVQNGQSTDGVFTAQQSSTVPDGFVKSLVATVTTADSSIGASQRYFVAQKLEGLNTFDFGWGTAAAQTVTLSFWVRSSLTGTFGGSIKNSDSTRSYPFTYSISSANTWEQKTVTIAGDTSGTWLSTNGLGLAISWSLGAGSSFVNTAGAWAAGNYFGAPGQTNLIATNGATFYITGVQLEKGSTATSFDYRPYGTELVLCQRYYFRMNSGVTAFCPSWANSTTTTRGFCRFPVDMRTSPAALEQSGTATDYRVFIGNAITNCSSVPTFATGSIYGADSVFTVASGLTIGQGGTNLGGASTNGFLGWSAEL